MLNFFLSIIFFSIILTLLILNKCISQEGKKKRIAYLLFFFSIFVPVIIIYFQSNYWVGDNVLNKVYNNLNIREVNKIDPGAISNLLIS